MDTRPNIEIVPRLSAIHNLEIIMDTDRTKQNQTPQTSVAQRFNRILTHHLKEWKNSCIDEYLTTLNLISLSGFTTYEYLLYALPLSERRNDGRLRDKWLRRYAHIEPGGWWCGTVDVLTGEDSEWGCFKPDNPYEYSEKPKGFDPESNAKNKRIKYEHPPKVPTEIFALKVPLHLWKAISLRYDVPLPENITVTPEGRAIGFWAWVIAHPEIPLIITEGAKKAGCLITAHYVALALPGINNGYRQPKDSWGNKIELPYLIPQLQAFAQQGREIIFGFDHDAKPKTIKNVRRAIARTGGLFAKEGCRVSVITWDYPEKGVDDLIAARGVDCFGDLYKARIPLSRFNLRSILDLSKYNPLKVNVPYLSDNLIAPEDAQIIGLRSPKGTAKTEWLSEIVSTANRTGKPALVITHRIQLAKALCNRFGIDHIEEIKNSETGGILGYGLCIDSLHPNSQARFNPEDWSGALVILDECEQVIWHMLESTTCQDNRVAIIENFQQLLKIVIGTGGKVYLSDADLSAISIDYVKKLIDIPVKTWVVENVYQRSKKRKLIGYSGNDPRELISALVKAISLGEKVLIHTTGQKAKSKYGSINLESYLKKKFPSLRIIRIDRESVAEPNHPACGCMGNLNQILSNYDIAIASPVIETGVSIDLKGHFDSVWCIAYGVQTVDAICQTVERLRDGVPRHIWVKKTAKNNRIGNGSTSIKALLHSQHKLTRANIFMLQQAGISEFDDLEVNFSPESLTAWAKRACVVNAGKNNYREEVIHKLLSEGYELQEPNQQQDENSSDSLAIDSLAIKNELKQTCKENYQTYCQAVTKAVTPSDLELEKLNNKKSKTPEERHQERKGNLSKRYGVKITPELVEKDDNGWYPQLQLQYYLTVGNAYLAERDKRSLNRIREQGNNKAFKPDINKKQLSAQVEALRLIGIEQFLNPEASFTKDNLADWLENVIKYRYQLKIILGVTINPERDSAIAVAQRILNKLGQKLEFLHQVRIDGKPTRIYRGCNPNRNGRSLVFQYWLERSAVTPFSKEELDTEGGVTAA